MRVMILGVAALLAACAGADVSESGVDAGPIIVFGDASVGDRVAWAAAGEGFAVVRQFDGARAGISAFCSSTSASTPSILVLPVASGGVPSCSGSGSATAVQQSGDAYIVFRQSNLEANAALDDFSKSLGADPEA